MLRIPQLKIDITKISRNLSMEDEIKVLRPFICKQLGIKDGELLEVRI